MFWFGYLLQLMSDSQEDTNVWIWSTVEDAFQTFVGF